MAFSSFEQPAMAGKDSRSIHGAVKSSRLLALVVGCLLLPENSEAMPLAEHGSDAGPELSLAIPPEQSLSTAAFLLSEWLTDTGSGGFPVNFSDEYRLIDEWEGSPDEVSSGSFSYKGICVHWTC